MRWALVSSKFSRRRATGTAKFAATATRAVSAQAGAAVALGIFEALPAREREVAERCGLRSDGARRILRALCELGLTRRRGDSWTLTSRGEYLKEEHPLTLADAAIEYAGAFTKMWSRLPEALANDTAWEAPDIFEQVARDEHRREGHHRMLRSYARHDYAVVCGALGLRNAVFGR